MPEAISMEVDQRFSDLSVAYANHKQIKNKIIAKSASETIESTANAIHDSLKKTLVDNLSQYLEPHFRFQFEHVQESGFRIWGKKENIALSKRTILEIFSAIYSDPAKFNPLDRFGVYGNDMQSKALFKSGYKSGRIFVDDLCDLLINKTQMDLPDNIAGLVHLCIEFDEQSAWWDQHNTFYPEKDYYSLELTRPFTKFPFVTDGVEDATPNFSAFLEGYLVAIFNGCSDLLFNLFRIMRKEFHREICINVKDVSEGHSSRGMYRIYFSKKYVSEYMDIDRMCFALQRSMKIDKDRVSTSRIEQKLRLLRNMIVSISSLDKFKVPFSDDGFNKIYRRIDQYSNEVINNYIQKTMLEAIYYYELIRSTQLGTL